MPIRNLPVVSVAVLLLSFVASAGGDEIPQKLRIATWNLEWFYDDYTGDNPSKLAREQSAPSREEWDWKLGVTAKAIAALDATIVCLQEVESRRTMYSLVKTLREKHDLDYRLAFIEGSDVFTEQDVCILARTGLVEFSRREQSREMFQSKDYYDLQKHIFAEFEWGAGDSRQRLYLLNIHLRAMEDKEDIRKRQAKLCHYWLRDRIKAGDQVILLGDCNTNRPFGDQPTDSDIGILRGLNTPEKDDDLFDAHELIPEDKRETHIIHKQFDRILVSNALKQDDPAKPNFVLTSASTRPDLNARGKELDKDHWEVYWKIPQDERDVSDHIPLVVEFELK